MSKKYLLRFLSIALVGLLLLSGCQQPISKPTPKQPTSKLCQSIYDTTFDNYDWNKFNPNKCVYDLLSSLTPLSDKEAKRKTVNSNEFLNAYKRTSPSKVTKAKIQDETIGDYLMTINWGRTKGFYWYIVIFDPEGLKDEATYKSFLNTETI